MAVSMKDRTIKFILRMGEDATITSITGTVCPCTQRNGNYNPQYHADFPTAQNCNGTKLISRTVSVVNFKAIFYPAGLMGITGWPGDTKEVIGTLKETDTLMYIPVANFDTLDISVYKDADFVTYNSREFLIRKTYPVPNIGYCAILEEK
jgi:hypothetical protein